MYVNRRKKNMKLNVVIERQDGTSYTQLVEVKEGKTIKQALKECKDMLGKGYYICTWWEVSE